MMDETGCSEVASSGAGQSTQRMIDAKSLRKISIVMTCAWSTCSFTVADDVHGFADHVSDHLDTTVADDFRCQWTDCTYSSDSTPTPTLLDIARHVSFHAYHTRLLATGFALKEACNLPDCAWPTNRRNELPELPDLRFICLWSDCHATAQEFIEINHFQSHVDTCHLNSLSERAGEEARRCRWADCDVKCVSVAHLKAHVRTHVLFRAVGCPRCGTLFSKRSMFYDHCREGRPVKQFECKLCRRVYKSEKKLKRHIIYHVDMKQCPVCPMTLPDQISLNRHIIYRHSNDRPFKCDQCKFTAKTEYDLTLHVKNKHMERTIHRCPYTVDHCIRSDTDPTSSDSRQCDRTFKSFNGLQLHIRIVHQDQRGAYACHLCTKRYNIGSRLTTHLISCHQYVHPMQSGQHKKPRFVYLPDNEGLFRLSTGRILLLQKSKEEEEGEETPDLDSSPTAQSESTDQ